MGISVHVAELFYPGTRIEDPDRDWAFKTESLLSTLEGALVEAAIALNLFLNEEVAAIMPAPVESDFSSHEDYQAFFDKIAQGDNSRNFLAELEFHRIVARRKWWEDGVWPEAYRRQRIFSHAKSFVTALHLIGKLLEVLAQDPKLPQTVAQQKKEIDRRFPDLLGVRDSVAHFDERIQGRAKPKGSRKAIPITPAPISTPAIKTGSGFLVLNTLNGRHFSITMADGQLGAIEVSPESLYFTRDRIQEILNALRWEGHPRYSP